MVWCFMLCERIKLHHILRFMNDTPSRVVRFRRTQKQIDKTQFPVIRFRSTFEKKHTRGVALFNGQILNFWRGSNLVPAA